jgi:hypothetical protein
MKLNSTSSRRTNARRTEGNDGWDGGPVLLNGSLLATAGVEEL